MVLNTLPWINYVHHGCTWYLQRTVQYAHLVPRQFLKLEADVTGKLIDALEALSGQSPPANEVAANGPLVRALVAHVQRLQYPSHVRTITQSSRASVHRGEEYDMKRSEKTVEAVGSRDARVLMKRAQEGTDPSSNRMHTHSPLHTVPPLVSLVHPILSHTHCPQ